MTAVGADRQQGLPIGAREMDAAEFKHVQKELGLRNYEMARMLGCSLSSITKYRAGEVDVPKAFCKFLRLLLEINAAVAGLYKASNPQDAQRIAARLASASGDVMHGDCSR